MPPSLCPSHRSTELMTKSREGKLPRPLWERIKVRGFSCQILQKICGDGDDEVKRQQQNPFPPVTLIIVDDQPHAANGHTQSD